MARYFQDKSYSCVCREKGGLISISKIFILDFDGIKVLAPSWADEFISGIKSEYSNSLQYINTENPSVKATLKAVIDSPQA